MAEGDECWLMVVLGADLGRGTKFCILFLPFFLRFLSLAELNHPEPRSVLLDACLFSVCSQSQPCGAHVDPDTRRAPPRSAIDQDEAQTCRRRGVPAIINPPSIDWPLSIEPIEGTTQASNGLHSPPLSPVPPPLHLQTIKNYCNGFIDTANMHVHVASVCILANNAHNAEDCLAGENAISSEHGDEEWLFSPRRPAGAEVDNDMWPWNFLEMKPETRNKNTSNRPC